MPLYVYMYTHTPVLCLLHTHTVTLTVHTHTHIGKLQASEQGSNGQIDLTPIILTGIDE